MIQSEMQQFLNMKITKCFVIQFPSGRWGFVGNVSEELCHKSTKGFYETMVSNSYDTEKEAKEALSKIK